MKNELQHFHFVTGRLAEHSVRATVHHVAKQVGFEYSIQVLPITVAALMTAKWLLRKINVPERASSVVLPGFIAGDVAEIESQLQVPVVVGPKDIRDLPLFFGEKRDMQGYGRHSIDILAEINHANRLALAELVASSARMIEDGADLIDLGCTPGEYWPQVGEAVSALQTAGYRVSIDSFCPREVALACDAGAELVLSVNSSNRQAAADWGVEVVVIPDSPGDKKSFCESIDFLANASVPIRLDPILEPIRIVDSQTSLERFFDCRREYPDATMLMGIGNITELTDSDSGGLNTLLLGICQELAIQSVLTTQVINWARTSVRECHLARQLVHFACQQQTPPKHLEPDLVLLRDERVNQFDVESITALAKSIRDKNIRIFNCQGQIHAVSRGLHVHGSDPFRVMEQLLGSELGQSITPSHAFYLGFEMCKAHTANTLSKQYTQDETLNWGFLTDREAHHRLSDSPRRMPRQDDAIP